MLDAGAEVPFEVVDAGAAPRRPALYCYRPLTDEFIAGRWGRLIELDGYAPALDALGAIGDLVPYLEYRGVSEIPADPVERRRLSLQTLLCRVFADRAGFRLDEERLGEALDELDRALTEERAVTTVIAPLLGLGLEAGTRRVSLGDGLSLIDGEEMPGVPAEAIWGSPGLGRSAEPNVLAVLTFGDDGGAGNPVPLARSRFRRILSALRLFERGSYALGPLAWVRAGSGAWRPVALGGSGRPGLITLLGAAQAEEFAAFTQLLGRRAPGVRVAADGGTWGLPPGARSGAGELAWALARFEMGCERLSAFEGLTDHLLALRVLLEPEGPHSGRLAQRLAVLCATPELRGRLAERTVEAIALERAVIQGTAPGQTSADALAHELSEHLRALLRDVICGHLEPDLCAIADELLADTATLAA